MIEYSYSRNSQANQINYSSDTSSFNKKTIKQVDIKDVLRYFFNKNSVPKSKNNSQKNIAFAILPSVNYSILSGFSAGANTVAIFNLSKEADTKPSSIRTFSNYSQYKQFVSILNTNIWTRKNKLNLLGDIRFYKFPANTYGLGGNTTFDDANLVDYRHLRLYQVALRKISKSFDAGVGYHLDYHWKIHEINEKDLGDTDLKKYGLTPKSTSS
jgi:hypothetical protein